MPPSILPDVPDSDLSAPPAPPSKFWRDLLLWVVVGILILSVVTGILLFAP